MTHLTSITPQPVPSGYVLDKRTCARAARGIGWLLRRLKLVVNHAGGTQNIPEGDIFVFNHFTRFETVIVSWLLYRQTGRFIRAVADKALFRANPYLARVMRALGAVPNNLDNLLPFLAAEVMRGNKVLVFPEGGMVKDRKVRDDKGRLEMFSGHANQRRKPHKGAAVLAVALDIFKHHLRDLEAKGDMDTLLQWCHALHISTMTDLLKQAHKPTHIIPGNITYFPIRTGDNLLSRIVRYWWPEAPLQAFEELIIEGNILFKTTDMDINFGPPILALPNLSASEKKQVHELLEGLVNLSDLFVHKQENLTPTGRKMASLLLKHSEQVTEAYAGAIYQHTTLNMNHLVATAIAHLHSQKRYEIPHKTFRTAMYLAIKKMHAAGTLHLHCSLDRPWFYHGILEGQAPAFRGFMKTCAKVHLLKKTPTTYRFSHRLDDVFDDEDIRLENPVALHANEAASVPLLKKFVQEALAEADTVTPAEMAYHQLDDMQRAHKLRHKFWVHRTPTWAPTRDDPTKAMPYLLEAKGRKASKTAVVMVHGFTSHPGEVRNLAEKIHAAGHTVVGVCLFGHGTTPLDLERRTRKEWVQGVMQGYRVAAGLAPHVVLVGFSTGGAICLTMAGQEDLPQLKGLASIAAPLTVRDKNINLLPPVMPLFNMVRKLVELPFGLRFYPSHEPVDGLHYPVKPIVALNELRLLMQELPSHLKHVKVPVLLVQGDADQTVEPSSVEGLDKGLENAPREKHIIPGGPHSLVYDDVGDTHTLVLNFLQRLDEGA